MELELKQLKPNPVTVTVTPVFPHVDWSPHLRKSANMKIQVPHFRGGFGITPNEGSAISTFYSATCALVNWLGSNGGTRLRRYVGAQAESYFS